MQQDLPALSSDSPEGSEDSTPPTIGDGVEDVLFCYYPFLSPDTVHQLDFLDFRYLESQGCFRFPGRKLLDDFVTVYRSNVHPHQPIFRQSEVDQIHQGESITPATMSIFVFQAMLFAASSVRASQSFVGYNLIPSSTSRSRLYNGWGTKTIYPPEQHSTTELK